MVASLQGINRNGKIGLPEPPPSEVSEARVLVTFLPAVHPIRLADHGIDQEQAADLRGQLRAIAEDWERPEMDVYDEATCSPSNPYSGHTFHA